MQTQLNPYISFKDNTRQAMEFYQTVFGGTVTLVDVEKANLNGNGGAADQVRPRSPRSTHS